MAQFSQNTSDSQNLSLSSIPLAPITIHDLYEMIYRLVGGILLYVVIFHDGLYFSANSIISLFFNGLFPNTLFGNIFLLTFLLSLSLIATYFFSFMNISLYLLFYLSKQFKTDSMFYKLIIVIIDFFFPRVIPEDDDEEEKNFSKGIEYLYSKVINSRTKDIPSPISASNFFEIIKDYVQSKTSDLSDRRDIGLVNLGECIFMSVLVLDYRLFFEKKYILLILLMCFNLIVLNSIKKDIEYTRNSVLTKFYSMVLFRDTENKSVD